ncbi:pali-domain-containing protein [Dendrothele bispora CBS 962.96]|uniref:Pali-domain-containing protein n=1 Tax=Dendrothele bispora (strain CBS 962.96) TaxID=1314807 RepID=A0A4S8MG52_DENBC|nr:pali-domain-containing protein [Dendrothele bispora CBS 962.96]
MTCLRPATPGFICTLVATILLAVVSFCVPYLKSVFFLQANIDVGGVNGTITFGTLGYCENLSGTTTCSSPSVGYQLDINSLVGNNTGIDIPQVAVKWLTYALVLHIVALILAAISSLFGLLAHVREMSMAYCSTCISGFAAAVALVAFIFDIALFFIAKARINAVGSASIGNAIWLTLAAWILLFFSGCFYTIGRCCISSRKPRKDNEIPHDPYAEQMRLDAVKAEADRKATQKEGGLPAFYSESQPLTGRVDGDNVYADSPYQDNTPQTPHGGYGRRPSQTSGYAHNGYVQAPAGTRAVDEYYNPTQPQNTSAYPPQPQRQASSHSHHPQRQGSGHTYATSNYAPSTYNNYASAQSPPAQPLPSNQYLGVGQQSYPERYGTPGREYGHATGGSTYYSAHEQHPSSYSQYDQPRTDPYNPYNSTPPQTGYGSQATSYYSAAATTPGAGPERSYTLGGDGYGMNSVPPLPERQDSVPPMPDHPSATAYNIPYAGTTAPINTNSGNTSPVKGPRPPPGIPTTHSSPVEHEDSPPGYDAGTSGIAGAWGKS